MQKKKKDIDITIWAVYKLHVLYAVDVKMYQMDFVAQSTALLVMSRLKGTGPSTTYVFRTVIDLTLHSLAYGLH